MDEWMDGWLVGFYILVRDAYSLNIQSCVSKQ